MVVELSKNQNSEKQEPYDLIQDLNDRRDAAYRALQLKNEPSEKLQEGLTGFWKDLEPLAVLPTLPKQIDQDEERA